MGERGNGRVGDTVLGAVERDRLANVLASIHRGGFGPLARVFDPARGPLAEQLTRAGLPLPPEAGAASVDAVILAVTAPGRALRVADAMSRGGARRVYVTAAGRGSPSSAVVPVETGGAGAAGEAAH